VAVSKDRQRYWAKLGAKMQLSELREKIAEILRTYPNLRHAESSPAGSPGRRRRRHISAEARARMSEGMRKYWAKRKAQKSQKPR
jgi:hypothetical protein